MEAMELPWVMRKALRLVSELQARWRRALRRTNAESQAPEASSGGLTTPPRAQIRHDEAEFATCLRAGIINVAETYSFKGAALWRLRPVVAVRMQRVEGPPRSAHALRLFRGGASPSAVALPAP